jgi:hypothetical protein
VPWKGKNLYCVRFDTGSQQKDDSGISCDWIAYHMEEIIDRIRRSS